MEYQVDLLQQSRQKDHHIFFEKSSEIFLSVQPGCPTAGEKNKKVFKYHFYGDNFANWTILDHFQKNFPIQNFLDHPINFGGRFCDFGHF